MSESYGYDKQNRLATVTPAGLTTDFTYGPHGARRDKAVRGGATTRYLRSGPDVIAEYNGAALLARFIHGPGTDDPVAVIDNTGARHFYHADATGTIVALSGETGLLEERYATDPFGAVDSASGLANYRFAGRPYDLETGLYYNRARYYHPGLGRFLSPDPTGYADGLNMYAYAANDPVNLADPSGLNAKASGETAGGGSRLVPESGGVDSFFMGGLITLTGGGGSDNLWPGTRGVGLQNTLERRISKAHENNPLTRLPRLLRNKLKAINNQINAGGRRGVSGSVSPTDATRLGQRFVGPNYTVSTAKNGVTILHSKGRLLIFRGPKIVKGVNPKTQEPWSKTGVQVNFESRPSTSVGFSNNVHLDVK